MLKGLQALFTSGILLDPLVLLGLVLGGGFYWGLTGEQIRAIYFDYRFYALSFIICLIYNFMVRPVYRLGGFGIDNARTFANVVLSCLKFVLSSLLMMAFISFWSFGGDETENYKSVENFEFQLKK